MPGAAGSGPRRAGRSVHGPAGWRRLPRRSAARPARARGRRPSGLAAARRHLDEWPARAPSVATRLRLAPAPVPPGGQVRSRTRRPGGAPRPPGAPRAGVQPVLVRHREHGARPGSPSIRGGRGGVGRQVRLLAGKRQPRLRPRPRRCSRRPPPRRPRPPGPRPAGPGTAAPGRAPRRRQQVEGQLGAEHRAAEVHQHDHAGRGCRPPRWLPSPGPRRCRTSSRRGPAATAMRPLGRAPSPGQGDGGARAAPGCARRRRCRPMTLIRAPSVPAAAVSSSADAGGAGVLVARAPLRSPR